MRAFLSVNLDSRMKENIAGLQERLRQQTRGIRWVRPDLLHFTLKFLGNIQVGDYEAFEQPLRELAKNTDAFHFALGRLGAFPNRHSPRVIWIGMQTGADRLTALANKIGNVPASFAHLQSGPFVPHLTIGRRKKDAVLHFPAEAFQEHAGFEQALIDRFFLMQSSLYPTGPIYSPIKEFLLR